MAARTGERRTITFEQETFSQKTGFQKAFSKKKSEPGTSSLARNPGQSNKLQGTCLRSAGDGQRWQAGNSTRSGKLVSWEQSRGWAYSTPETQSQALSSGLMRKEAGESFQDATDSPKVATIANEVLEKLDHGGTGERSGENSAVESQKDTKVVADDPPIRASTTGAASRPAGFQKMTSVVPDERRGTTISPTESRPLGFQKQRSTTRGTISTTESRPLGFQKATSIRQSTRQSVVPDDRRGTRIGTGAATEIEKATTVVMNSPATNPMNEARYRLLTAYKHQPSFSHMDSPLFVSAMAKRQRRQEPRKSTHVPLFYSKEQEEADRLAALMKKKAAEEIIYDSQKEQVEEEPPQLDDADARKSELQPVAEDDGSEDDDFLRTGDYVNWGDSDFLGDVNLRKERFCARWVGPRKIDLGNRERLLGKYAGMGGPSSAQAEIRRPLDAELLEVQTPQWATAIKENHFLRMHKEVEPDQNMVSTEYWSSDEDPWDPLGDVYEDPWEYWNSDVLFNSPDPVTAWSRPQSASASYNRRAARTDGSMHARIDATELHFDLARDEERVFAGDSSRAFADDRAATPGFEKGRIDAGSDELVQAAITGNIFKASAHPERLSTDHVQPPKTSRPSTASTAAPSTRPVSACDASRSRPGSAFSTPGGKSRPASAASAPGGQSRPASAARAPGGRSRPASAVSDRSSSNVYSERPRSAGAYHPGATATGHPLMVKNTTALGFEPSSDPERDDTTTDHKSVQQCRTKGVARPTQEWLAEMAAPKAQSKDSSDVLNPVCSVINTRPQSASAVTGELCHQYASGARPQSASAAIAASSTSPPHPRSTSKQASARPQSASCVRSTQNQDLHTDAPWPQSASFPRAEEPSQYAPRPQSVSSPRAEEPSRSADASAQDAVREAVAPISARETVAPISARETVCFDLHFSSDVQSAAASPSAASTTSKRSVLTHTRNSTERSSLILAMQEEAAPPCIQERQAAQIQNAPLVESAGNIPEGQNANTAQDTRASRVQLPVRPESVRDASVSRPQSARPESVSRPQSARPESAAGSKQAPTTPHSTSFSLAHASPTQLEGRHAPSTYEGIKEVAVRASASAITKSASRTPNRLQSASKRGPARPQSASCARSVRPQSASSASSTSKKAAAAVRPQSATLERTSVADVDIDDASKTQTELHPSDAPQVPVRWDSPAFKTRADRAPQTVRAYSIVQGALDAEPATEDTSPEPSLLATGNQLPVSTGGCDAPGQTEVNSCTIDSSPKPSRPSSAQHTGTTDSSPKPSRPSSAQRSSQRPSSAQSSRPQSPRSWRVVEPATSSVSMIVDVSPLTPKSPSATATVAEP